MFSELDDFFGKLDEKDNSESIEEIFGTIEEENSEKELLKNELSSEDDVIKSKEIKDDGLNKELLDDLLFDESSMKKKIESAESAELEKSKESVTIPKELFSRLLDLLPDKKEDTRTSVKSNDINVDAFAKVIKDLVSGNSEHSGMVGRPIYMSEIDNDDILSPPALFFSMCQSTIIFDDIKNGRAVMIPIQPVKFSNLLRYQNPKDKEEIIAKCVAVVHSKKQADFIRNHSLFGIKYFEDVRGNSSNITNSFADKLAIAYAKVSSMSESDVHRKIINLDIKVDTMDISILRKKLAERIATNMQNEESVNDQFQRAYEITLNSIGGSSSGVMQKDLSIQTY